MQFSLEPFKGSSAWATIPGILVYINSRKGFSKRDAFPPRGRNADKVRMPALKRLNINKDTGNRELSIGISQIPKIEWEQFGAEIVVIHESFTKSEID